MLEESTAAPAAISTVTSPSADGVMSAVYVLPEPRRFPAVPLPTVISPSSNPVISSLKVIVTGMGEVFVGLAAVEEIATVGAVASKVTVLSVVLLAVLRLFATSNTLFSAMAAMTVPSLVIPLTAILKVVPSLGAIWLIATLVAPAVPLKVISSAVKMLVLIGSSNIAVKLMALALDGSD